MPHHLHVRQTLFVLGDTVQNQASCQWFRAVSPQQCFAKTKANAIAKLVGSDTKAEGHCGIPKSGLKAQR